MVNTFADVQPAESAACAPEHGTRVDSLFASADRSTFSLVQGEPTANLHMAFGTDDDGDVQRFHAAALEAGYRDNGAPGERPRYHPGYYAAYVLDPDGNNVEAVNHGPARRSAPSVELVPEEPPA